MVRKFGRASARNFVKNFVPSSLKSLVFIEEKLIVKKNKNMGFALQLWRETRKTGRW